MEMVVHDRFDFLRAFAIFKLERKLFFAENLKAVTTKDQSRCRTVILK